MDSFPVFIPESHTSLPVVFWSVGTDRLSQIPPPRKAYWETLPGARTSSLVFLASFSSVPRLRGAKPHPPRGNRYVTLSIFQLSCSRGLAPFPHSGGIGLLSPTMFCLSRGHEVFTFLTGGSDRWLWEEASSWELILIPFI